MISLSLSLSSNLFLLFFLPSVHFQKGIGRGRVVVRDEREVGLGEVLFFVFVFLVGERERERKVDGLRSRKRKRRRAIVEVAGEEEDQTTSLSLCFCSSIRLLPAPHGTRRSRTWLGQLTTVSWKACGAAIVLKKEEESLELLK